MVAGIAGNGRHLAALQLCLAPEKKLVGTILKRVPKEAPAQRPAWPTMSVILEKDKVIRVTWHTTQRPPV